VSAERCSLTLTSWLWSKESISFGLNASLETMGNSVATYEGAGFEKMEAFDNNGWPGQILARPIPTNRSL
jgi:hypothetical protein